MADPKKVDDVFSFIVGMTDALAWPVALVVAVLLLRQHIAAALKRMRTLKYGDAEVAFSTELSSSQKIAEEHGVTTFRPIISFDPAIISLAEASPTGAVLEGWKQAEVELRALSARAGLSWQNASHTIKLLGDRGLLFNGLDEILRQMMRTRNSAVHDVDPSITPGEAMEYLMLAKSVSERLRSVEAPASPFA